MQRYSLIVMTNPVEGRDGEYNDWYTNTHLHDVLKIPGIIGAQRFRRSDTQRDSGPFPWGYLAIYECETDDSALDHPGTEGAGGTELMRMTDALGAGSSASSSRSPK